ncbi:hypothetical protein P0D73_41780 [Paraburkholderia sp. RL18-101-BIB-B]|jgi:hypothetical protein|uniref:hypothetical protein n=1 Tax=Paraburkholderia sp. RL18-101-BIB-B TaxID=3031634 RepID=UPI0038B79AD0
MQTLLKTLGRAIGSGSVAGSVSAAIAAARAPGEGATPYAPLNAVTHCFWPRRALAETSFSPRYTLTGLAIHHAAAMFWGLLFESMLMRRQREARRRPAAVVAAAGATAAVAYLVDYHAVPKRLTPGFEAHLSRRSLFYIYAGFAVGFAAAAMCRRD